MGRAVAPDTLLVSFSEAARLLSVDVATVRRLVAQGHITAHPILSDRIPRAEVNSFVQCRDAEANVESRRAMDDPTPIDCWETPPMRLRANGA